MKPVYCCTIAGGDVGSCVGHRKGLMCAKAVFFSASCSKESASVRYSTKTARFCCSRCGVYTELGVESYPD